MLSLLVKVGFDGFLLDDHVPRMDGARLGQRIAVLLAEMVADDGEVVAGLPVSVAGVLRADGSVRPIGMPVQVALAERSWRFECVQHALVSSSAQVLVGRA